MKRLALCLVIVVFIAPALLAQRVQQKNLQPNSPNPNNPNNDAGRARPAAAAAQNTNANEQLIQALYLSEFQRQVGVNDELTGRFRPILMQWIQQRRNVVARRNAAIAELRQLLASGAPESEITRQIGEVDQAENQTRNAERRLMVQVDPMLTPAQQARFRLFQVDMEQRIRELLDAARQPAPQANPQRANRPAAATEPGARRAGQAKQR